MKKRRGISLLCVLALLLSACGGGGESVEENKFTQRNKNAVYKEEPGVYALKDGDVVQMQVADDILYVEQQAYIYEENGVQEIEAEDSGEAGDMAKTAEAAVAVEPAEEEYTEPVVMRYLTSYQMDGTILNQISTKMDNNSGSGTMAVDSEGRIYNILYQYATYEGDDVTDKVYLERHAADGTSELKIWLNEKVQEDYYYVIDLYCTEDGLVVIDTSRGIEVYDQQGNPVKLIEKEEVQDNRLVKIRENKFAMITSTGDSAKIQTLDIQTGTYGEKQDIPFNYYMYGVYGGNYYDVYLTDEYGIYGYNLGDEEITKLVDYISSDFFFTGLSHFAFVDETTFVACYYGEDGNVLSRFTKVAPEDVAEKIDITLGCCYLDYNLKQQIIAFNQSSDTYRINIIDYSMYNTMDDYTQGVSRMNTDIISGEVPDILVLGNDMPVDSYTSKGIFADLNTFLEKDSEVKKEDLLSNVLEALSYEGGLYRIAPYFGVNTYAAKTSDVGEKQEWTMDEALKLLESKPEGTQLFSEITSSGFVYSAMAICGERYVDWEKGECYFDGEEFKKILEYAAALPKEIDYSNLDDTYWNEWETQYLNGKTLVSPIYLSDYRDYTYAKQATFGEDISLVGFPVEEGKGASLNVGNTMSISALSKNQEAAWEFVKYFFTEEYQDEMEFGLPLRSSSLAKREERATQKPFYLDDDGNKVEYEDTYYINGMEIPAEPLSKEEAAAVTDYIKSLNQLGTYNEAINQILMEEVDGYFAGQRTVEEVTDVIQSRVKIYINENS